MVTTLRANGFHFPDFRPDGTTLHFHWGTTQVALDIGVRSSAPAALTPEQIAPYLGFYDLNMFGEGPDPLEFDVELLDARGKLRGLVDDGEWAFELVRGDEDNLFYFGFLQDGQIVDIEEGPVHFDYEGDQLTGFTVYGIGIDVWMKAERRD